MPNEHPGPERIGHRGAPREFDENTIEGFVRAVDRGADAVELDVHLTRDDVAVVHHDPDVSGPAGRRPIRDMTLDDVRACVLPRGGRIPTLDEVFTALGDRATAYVELKGEGVGPAAVASARAHGHRYAFHSFDHDAVLALRAEWPALPYGVLLDEGVRDAAALVDRYPVRDLWAHWSLVDDVLVSAAHENGRRVIAWTVNDPAIARRFEALGVDGICTDDVRMLAPAP